MECYLQMFTKNAKMFQFLTVYVTATNNSAATVAEGAEAGNDKDGKVVMEDKEEKEKKPWKYLEGSNGFFIHKNMAENWCGSSPEWGESTVAMAQ